jgi:hypothetical protein
VQQNKVEAIYSLREAAERKATLEKRLELQPNRANRDALLDAQIDLEAKTQDAIEVCHECGHEHAGDQPHHPGRANVIDVDFGRDTS